MVAAVVETCRMDDALVSGLSLRLEGITVTVGAVPFDREMVADRDTIPANPPILVRIRLEEEFAPGWMTSWLGMGVTAKSRGRALGDDETALPPGTARVTELNARIMRTKLDTAREYLDQNKGTIHRLHLNGNRRYKACRWAARKLFRLRPHALS